MATTDTLAPPTDATPEASTTDKPLSVLTLPLYLLGDRGAIMRIAESRAALWVGLLFVLSAGFAREYDGADLLREPWHFALPLVASLGTSLVLYVLVFVAAHNRGVKELPFLAGYRTLLTFYWWTAPLAWLYAIPVERFMSAGDATAANLWFLAAVSVWRVLLITRALSVWLGTGFIGMFFIVMFFADTVALLLTFFSPQPIWNVMGGVRLSESDDTVLGAMLTVKFFGGGSWIVWFFAAAVVIGKQKPPWSLAKPPAAPPRVSKLLWAAAGLFIAFGLGLLPIGQPQQQNRSQAERLLRSGDLDAAAKYVGQYSRNDFPPVWDPPPRLGYGEQTPRVDEVLASAKQHDAPQWFRDLYVEKLAQDPSGMLWETVGTDGNGDPARFERILNLLEKEVPADSIYGEEPYELHSLSEDDRIDVKLRKRLLEYLGEPDDESTIRLAPPTTLEPTSEP